MTAIARAAATLSIVYLGVCPQTQSASELYRLNSVGDVGIHYWLEGADGTRVAESRAEPGKPYALHIRNNVGGWLSVWSTADGAQLTPMPRGGSGSIGRQAGSSSRQGPSASPRRAPPKRIFVLFARSQTEPVTTVEDGLAKLERLKPFQITETVSTGGGVGTDVVNVQGGQPGVMIRLMR